MGALACSPAAPEGAMARCHAAHPHLRSLEEAPNTLSSRKDLLTEALKGDGDLERIKRYQSKQWPKKRSGMTWDSFYEYPGRLAVG